MSSPPDPNRPTDPRLFDLDAEARAVRALRDVRRLLPGRWAAWTPEQRVHYVIVWLTRSGPLASEFVTTSARLRVTLAARDRMMYRRAVEILAAVSEVDGLPAATAVGPPWTQGVC